MSNYSRIVDYAAKDALTTGNPAKALKGTELGAEFDTVATMSATKEDTSNKNLANGYTGNNAANQSQALGFVPTGSAIPVNGMYSPAANQVGFATNTLSRGTISANGNWSIVLPTSGITLQVIGSGTSIAFDTHVALAADAPIQQFSRAALTPDGYIASVGTAGAFMIGSQVADLCIRGAQKGVLIGTGVTGYWYMSNAGGIVQQAPIGGVALTVNGQTDVDAVNVVGFNSSTHSRGLRITAGTTSADYNMLGLNASGTELFRVQGDGVFKLQSAGYTPSNVLTFANPPTITFANSNVFTLAMTGNISSAAWGLSGPLDGQSFIIFIKQDATGNRTIVWPASFFFPGGATPLLSTAANAKDMLVGTYSATHAGYFCTLSTGFA